MRNKASHSALWLAGSDVGFEACFPGVVVTLNWHHFFARPTLERDYSQWRKDWEELSHNTWVRETRLLTCPILEATSVYLFFFWPSVCHSYACFVANRDVQCGKVVSLSAKTSCAYLHE